MADDGEKDVYENWKNSVRMIGLRPFGNIYKGATRKPRSCRKFLCLSLTAQYCVVETGVVNEQLILDILTFPGALRCSARPDGWAGLETASERDDGGAERLKPPI